MLITWDAIPKDDENGHLLGYRLFYKKILQAGIELVGEQKFVDVVMDRYTFSYEMTGLESYTKYEIYLYGYSAYGDGPTVVLYGGNGWNIIKFVFLSTGWLLFGDILLY